jgi:hypothetical protein
MANIITSEDIKSFMQSATDSAARLALATPSPMAALVIDTAQLRNTKTIAAGSAVTFSGAPDSGSTFGLEITNSSGVAVTLTIPSSFSVAQQGAITSVSIAANGLLFLQWSYDGSTYFLYGDPPLTTGTGNFVLATSPTLVTPILGTPTSGNLANCTGYPGSGIGYVLRWSMGQAGSISANTTYYCGDSGNGGFSGLGTQGRFGVQVPKAGAVKGIMFTNFGSGGDTNVGRNVSCELWKTNASTGLSDAWDWPGAGSFPIRRALVTGSIAVAITDYLEIKVITPVTWTAPTANTLTVSVYIE